MQVDLNLRNTNLEVVISATLIGNTLNDGIDVVDFREIIDNIAVKANGIRNALTLEH